MSGTMSRCAAVAFDRSYPGTTDQARAVRADLKEFAGGFPVVDELVLLASELVTNAVMHTRSGDAGQTFTVRATLSPGTGAAVEVIDKGGAWGTDEQDDEHGRGLAIVAAIAGAENWGITGDEQTRAVWFRLDWP